MDIEDDFIMSLPDSDSEDVDLDIDSNSVDTSSTEREPSAKPPTPLQQATSTVTKLLKEKGKEWDQLASRKGPLTLLELPVDILRLIVKEIMHTNDLTSLALTNSTLHSLAIPHIYARFDIVWPDTHATSSDHKSVDALTYGLSTLSLGSSFGRIRQRLLRPGPPQQMRSPFDRVGNNYAAHTRKFSLGDGPPEWVAAYMITKESGKMLGTLVSLAVAKMINLETFIWDMPTGVLAEIFLALASLPDGHKDGQCNLETVWIRWHDNSEGQVPTSNPVIPPGSTLTPVGIMLPPAASHPKPRPALPYSASPVEYPTFSVLPPLKSLTALDIDELAYLDEISMLVERSQDRLQELRIGISKKAQHKDFVQAWDGPELHQVDHQAHWPGASTIGNRRLGGVLGILVGRIYDIRRKPRAWSSWGKSEPSPCPPKNESPDSPEQANAMEPSHDHNATANRKISVSSDEVNNSGQVDREKDSKVNSASTAPVVAAEDNIAGGAHSEAPQPGLEDGKAPDQAPRRKHSASRSRLEGKLRLRILELERIPLSMQVCSKAIDWTTLTTLTILDCAQHESLWKLLKRQYQPTVTAGGYGISSSSRGAQLQYHLGLKRLRTDTTSPSLITFLSEVLAPNTLEVLFLQDRRRSPSVPAVTIESIFKGPLKRHRGSLRKLLLDSSARSTKSGPATVENDRWRHWVLTSRILHYITSGRLVNLRELAVSIAYADWHTFLQRLPNMPQLRSLNIPHVMDHVVSAIDPKELALQIADIITLRPEVQLCYIGISTKCFEILETTPGDRGGGTVDSTGSAGGSGSGQNSGPTTTGPQAMDMVSLVEPESEEDHQDESSEEEDADETEDEDDGINNHATAEEAQSDGHTGESWDSDDDGFVDPDHTPAKKKLRLREILFYDDKVAIFKARHGRL
ncbi:F-box domain-containing protein [Pyricularia oryzae]|nr:F-box domain-containing protein [Pyricularia oryzae]